MRIVSVETVLLTGPSSNDPWINFAKTNRSAAFVEIRTDAGLTGVGETYAGYFGAELVPPIVDYLRPVLLGSETTDPDVLGARMRSCIAYIARVGVGAGIIAAIEAALWDLRGKAEGVPVHELFGGPCHDRIPGYATGGPSPWPLDQLLRKAERYWELGFTAFKVASGYLDMSNRQRVEPSEPGLDALVEVEVAKVQRLRDELGPDFGILLDGHMGGAGTDHAWDLDTATAVLQALEPLDLVLFEEPLPYTDPDVYAELRRRTTVPVAGGEQLSTAEEFRLWMSRGAFGIAQPDAAWVSIPAFVEIGRSAEASGVQIASHNWCAGVGVMQNIHAAFASPATAIVELIPDAGELHTLLWGESLQLQDGHVLPPQAPGLGVNLTDEIKNRFPFRPGNEEFASVPGKQLMS